MSALQEGQVAPDFTLSTSTGERVSLSQFRGQRVVLYFYPKDFTSGCTKEACSFRDHYPALTGVHAVVLGVSRDPPTSHVKFAAKYQLPFTLLSDPDATVARQYGVYKLKTLYGRQFYGIERTTFMIDEAGRIKKIFPKVKVDGHAEAVLRALTT